MKLKHWGIFVALNIVVSAITTLALLVWWEQAHPSSAVPPTAEAQSAAPVPTLAPVAGASPVVAQPPALPPTSFPHIVHTVQSGDTLSAISRRYNVSVRYLLAANNLAIDAVLHVGQQILVPGITAPPIVAAPASPAPAPTSASPELVTPAGPSSVEIRHVVGRGNLDSEAVVLANLGRQVKLRDWKLADSQGNVYVFPDLTLWQGGTITVHTGAGPDSVTDLYWKRTAPVWADPGDVVTLSDAGGKMLSRYQLP
jgi:hypothetical protein